MKWIFFILIGFTIVSPAKSELNQYAPNETIKRAQIIERIAPDFPRAALVNKQEGMVIVDYVIEKDGTVSDIVFVEGIGPDSYRISLEKALRKWTYEPATKNGLPIRQTRNRLEYKFPLHTQGDKFHVSRKYKKRYDKAIKLLQTKNNSFNEALESLKEVKHKTLQERLLTNLLIAAQEEINGDFEKQLYILKQANSELKFYNIINYEVIHKIFVLQFRLKHLAEALETLAVIKGLEEAKPLKKEYEKITQKIIRVIGDGDTIQTNKHFFDGTLSSVLPIRPRFRVNIINGTINKLEMRCHYTQLTYEFSNETIWQLPSLPESCIVYLFGDKNTDYEIEHLKESYDKGTDKLTLL